VKEKATYRRFDPLAFLAILGCIGMLLFECIFIFELYDRAPDEIANLIPSPVSPPVVGKTSPVARTNIAPVSAESGAPAVTNATPAKVESVPPVTPVG
jgi:hypothetical protein